MSTKLTLTLDPDIIDQAKKYAKQQQISLSKLVEFYFKRLGKDQTHDFRVPPLTKKLLGYAKVKSSESDKEMLKKALSKKH